MPVLCTAQPVKNKKLFRLSVSLALTFLLASFFILVSGSRIYRALEYKALDLRFILRGAQAVQAPIVHIDIDDISLQNVGRWPWPRVYHARLMDILSACGARQVLMDVLFMEPQQSDPQMDTDFAGAMQRAHNAYLPSYFDEPEVPPSPQIKVLLEQDISISPEQAAEKLGTDARGLQEALPAAKKYLIRGAVREIIGLRPGITEEEMLGTLEEARKWFFFPAEEAYARESFASEKAAQTYAKKFSVSGKALQWPYASDYEGLSVPIEKYSAVLKGSGFINADPDQDGVTRRAPLFIRYEDSVIPQMAAAALLESLEVKDLEFRKGSVVLKDALMDGSRGDIVIPVDEHCAMFINWQGRWGESFKHIPYYAILQLYEVRQELNSRMGADAPSAGGEPLEELKDAEAELTEKLTRMVKGKICIVGLTATGTHDMRPVPLQENYPLVGTHANLIETVLSREFIRKAPLGFNAAIFFLIACLVAGCASLMKMWKSLVASLLLAAGYFAAAFLVFAKSGLWIDMVGPGGVILFGFSAITSFRYFTEEKEKLWIKQAFSHYLSGGVINELLNDPSKLKLGGERRNLSVFFSDVRGFTSFSESHQPEEVVAMLNEILTQQVEVVFKYSGTLDKFVGDELMAFFGAPGETHRHNHAITSVRVAVEIQQKMKGLQERWLREKKEALHIGIGINSGDMVVGNMGSLERMDYTVIGDNVNLGARLCSAAGKDEIIISEATYEQVKEEVVAEKLAPISVKGKANPIAIYRITGLKGQS